MDQKPLICELITKMGPDEAHPVLTPIGQDSSDSTASNSECLKMRSVKKLTIKTFQSLAGSLLWFACCTRPDISFSVHKLTKCTHAPTIADWALRARELFRIHLLWHNQNVSLLGTRSSPAGTCSADSFSISVLLNGHIVTNKCDSIMFQYPIVDRQH